MGFIPIGICWADHPAPPGALTGWDGSRPDAHAPAGVMADHTHAAGEWMVGYRFLYTRSDDLVDGNDDVSEARAAALGYASIPTSMDMYMHMLDLMYAPRDWLTLMLMPQYMIMDMDMKALPMSDHGDSDHGDHGGHAHSGPHGTEGIGDTVGGALVRLWSAPGHRLHVGLMASAPTGSVEEKMGGKFVHYGMQLGSGTWDAKPSLTYLGQAGAWSWGAQTGLTWRLESENDSGFRFGNVIEATSWGAYQVADNISLSTRLGYRYEGRLTGHYNGPHNHSSPPDLQRNYGGHLLEVGVGMNLVLQRGWLDGHRLGLEVLVPIATDYYGVQISRGLGVALNWSKSF